MFHLFTIEGLKPNVPLEKILHHPYRVDRKGDSARIRRSAEDGEGRGFPAGGMNRQGAGSYDRAASSGVSGIGTALIHAYQVMSYPVETVPAGMALSDAWERFRRTRLRYLLVMDGEALAGVLSDRDIFCSMSIENGRVVSGQGRLVRDIMSREIVSADPSTDIQRIAMVMFHRHIGVMPVVRQDGRLAGILTRGDILHALVKKMSLDLTV